MTGSLKNEWKAGQTVASTNVRQHICILYMYILYLMWNNMVITVTPDVLICYSDNTHTDHSCHMCSPEGCLHFIDMEAVLEYSTTHHFQLHPSCSLSSSFPSLFFLLISLVQLDEIMNSSVILSGVSWTEIKLLKG